MTTKLEANQENQEADAEPTEPARPEWLRTLDAMHRETTAANNQLGMLMMRLGDLTRTKDRPYRISIDYGPQPQESESSGVVCLQRVELGDEFLARLQGMVIAFLQAEVREAVQKLRESPAGALAELGPEWGKELRPRDREERVNR